MSRTTQNRRKKRNRKVRNFWTKKSMTPLDFNWWNHSLVSLEELDEWFKTSRQQTGVVIKCQ